MLLESIITNEVFSQFKQIFVKMSLSWSENTSFVKDKSFYLIFIFIFLNIFKYSFDKWRESDAQVRNCSVRKIKYLFQETKTFSTWNCQIEIESDSIWNPKILCCVRFFIYLLNSQPEENSVSLHAVSRCFSS